MDHSLASPQPTYARIATAIADHASRQPGRVAIIRGATAVTYAELNRDLAATIAAIAGFNLTPGNLAAIGHNDLYIQLLLAFGCEALGIVTGSFRPVEGAECHPLLAAADIVLTESEHAPTARRVVRITPAWIAATLAAPASPPILPAAAADDPLVVFRSSGTTGVAKRMLLTYRMMNERLISQHDPVRGIGLTPTSRFFAAMHFGVGSIYMGAANCLRLGATFMFAPGLSGLAALAAYQPTHMTILPFHLRRLLEQMPPSAVPGPRLPGLLVQTVGARLPTDLRRRALDTFCGDVMENYGANETGAIGTVDQSGLITLINHIEAEVIGPDGAALPAGEIGQLRIRGPGMAHAYIGDPAATAEMFRDGWFHPGDLATITGSGQLRLVGRRSDVLNLGGIKIGCADLESRILALPGVSDIALIQPGNAVEPTRVTVCVVTNAKFELAAFIAKLKPIIDYPFQVQPIPTIPRTTTGKILRTTLEESLTLAPA